MKTTVKTFWICMLLMLTCSISGKAIDLVQVDDRMAGTAEVSASLSSCSSTSDNSIDKKNYCSRIPSSHGLRMSNWETNRFPKLTLLINSVCAGWLKTIFSSETFFWCYPTTRIYSCKAALNYTTQIKTRTMHWRAVIIIFIRFGGFWFSQLFFLLISPFFSLLSWRDWRQVTFSVHIC